MCESKESKAVDSLLVTKASKELKDEVQDEVDNNEDEQLLSPEELEKIIKANERSKKK